MTDERSDSGRYFFRSPHDGMIFFTFCLTGVMASWCSCTSTSATPKKPIIAAT